MKHSISRKLLQDKISFEEAKQLQIKYSAHSSKINAKSKNNLSKEQIHILAAVDVAYFTKDEKEWGFACAVFWDRVQNRILETNFALQQIIFPYKAGFLGFREARVISSALKTAKSTPDLLMCDGHGLIHPRSFGEAVHLGLALNLPSFGIAKNPYIGYYDPQAFEKIKGNKRPIWENNSSENDSTNKKLGYYICLADGRKPVFISIGYKINLETAVQIAMELNTNHRQPEPLYIADKLTKEKVRGNYRMKS
ncbi:MAG: endonuclease V [Candidatus Hermodarchaeota archaeon]